MKGTTDYAERTPMDQSLTNGQAMHSKEYGRLMVALNDARRASGEYSPCQSDPLAHDSVDLEYGFKNGLTSIKRADFDREVARLTRARQNCSECPFLDLCKPLAEAAVTVDEKGIERRDTEGVIGGRLVDNTVTGQLVWNLLETGELPETLKLKD